MITKITTVEELLSKARACLDDQDSPLASQLALFEEYSSCFRALEEGGDLGEEDPEALTELQELHARILERANTLQEALQQEMLSLQTRGKAVMGYLDLLPRRISSIRTRKG